MGNSVVLYGASGHGKVIIDVLQCSNVTVENVIDDNPKASTILGIPIIKASNFDFENIKDMIISIGNNSVRKAISNRLKVNFGTAIHPTAILSKHIKIGKGTVVMAGVIINPEVTIGEHCIINTGVLVEHDCHIHDFVHVSPEVALAGNITIKEGAHIGIGATIIQGITIGRWVTIGAGSVIIKDVPDYAVVVGCPGKIIKYKEHNE